MKWAFIVAAHGAVRSGGRFRAIFDQHSDGGKKNRGRAYITVAHELCRVAYALWKQDRDWSETPPDRPGRGAAKRPGQRPAKQRRTRPGTGQPGQPMVAALTTNS